jgi:lipopolysaccharide assembly outer membrane protein LptD (OstA)
MRIWTALKSGLLTVLFLSLPVYAQQNVILKAEEMKWFYNPPLLVGEGKVRVSYGDIFIEAERIEINLDTAELRGWKRISLKVNSHRIEGESLEFNLRKREGVIQQPRGREGSVAFQAQEAYFSSQRIDLKKSSFTTCEYAHPHYHIKARLIQIYPGERLVVRDATFYLGSLPLFWTPVFVQHFTGKSRLLLPSPGYSDFAGWSVKSGYYFYLSPQMEGNLRLDWREKKGWAGGLEFFYRSKGGEGSITTYYLKEKDTKKERGMARVRHITFSPSSPMLKLAIDYFSDEQIWKNYLYFLSAEEKQVFPSFLSLTSTGESYSASIKWQPKITPLVDYPELLPRIRIDFFQPSVALGGLYLREQTELTNFVQDEKVTMRAYSSLNLSYPFTLLKFFRFRPSLNWQLFYYQPQEEAPYYKILDQQSLELFFRLTGKRGDLTHQLFSTLGYYHSTGLGEGFPSFDSKEKEASSKNLFSLNLENLFFWKSSPFFSLDLKVSYDLARERLKPLDGSLILPFSGGKIYTDFGYNFDDKDFSYLRSGVQIQKKHWYLETSYTSYPVSEWLSARTSFDLSKSWSISVEADYDLEKEKLEKLTYSVDVKFHCLGVKVEIQERPEIKYGLALYIVAFPSF